MKVADEVWTSLALLHQENPDRVDFSVEEIKARARRENWSIRPGFNVHASYHCLANKPANPANHRMLYEDSRGRKRLYRPGDPFHSERANGKIHPDRQDLLPAYQPLVDWYEEVYSRSPAASSLPPVAVPHQFPSSSEFAHEDKDFPGLEEMRSETAFVGPGGTVVLPQRLQQELKLKEGACLSVYREHDTIVLLPITEKLIRSLRGSLKGYSLLEDREREHRIEKQR